MDKDRIEGSAKQAEGLIKETIGKVTGDAKLQAEVMRLGEYTPLSEGETKTARITIDTQVDRAWNLWSLRAKGEV